MLMKLWHKYHTVPFTIDEILLMVLTVVILLGGVGLILTKSAHIANTNTQTFQAQSQLQDVTQKNDNLKQEVMSLSNPKRLEKFAAEHGMALHTNQIVNIK